ncbi:hypothetical protein [Streptomyces sp. Ac-502]|uniref:hypothetical protein n=1 Tax=Streptomyces sp. Ac-502 TaxID=3342801 RepID=UPI0038629C9C
MREAAHPDAELAFLRAESRSQGLPSALPGHRGRRAGEWQEIPVTRDRPWYALAWNARNRSPKALFDAIQGIRARAAAAGSELAPVVWSPGYRLLSGYIQHHLPHADGASHSQFLLMHSYLTAPEHRQIEPFFVSEEISLPAAEAPDPEAFPLAA